jgi:CRISPR-associated protein (TIGR02710 family)
VTFRGAVVSVGGSAEPIIKNLSEARPGFVLFVVSAGSKPEVEQNILPRLGYTAQYNCAQVPDETDLAACYEAVRGVMPGWLKDRGLRPEEVYVDITGATKPMSAGLAMAAAERFSHFTYVRGKERDKGGLGVVVSGTEEVFRTVNPWDKLATRERDRATWLFRSYYPNSAAEQLRQAADKCSQELQQELKTLAELSDLFADVDRFHFKELKDRYAKHREALHLVFSHRSALHLFEQIEQLAAHWKQLQSESYKGGAAVSATLRELLANAERRAAQGRYDDAVARLYRAAELFVQGKLYEAFGAKFGKVRRDQIPQQHLSNWMAAFGEAGNGLYVLAVKDGFRAMAFAPQAELREVAQRYESIDKHLQKRNNSILAHGVQACSEEGFTSLWAALLPVVEVREEEIPRWPELKL